MFSSPVSLIALFFIPLPEILLTCFISSIQLSLLNSANPATIQVQQEKKAIQ